jgi:hypothetical protein
MRQGAGARSMLAGAAVALRQQVRRLAARTALALPMPEPGLGARLRPAPLAYSPAVADPCVVGRGETVGKLPPACGALAVVAHGTPTRDMRSARRLARRSGRRAGSRKGGGAWRYGVAWVGRVDAGRDGVDRHRDEAEDDAVTSRFMLGVAAGAPDVWSMRGSPGSSGLCLTRLGGAAPRPQRGALRPLRAERTLPAPIGFTRKQAGVSLRWGGKT